MKPDSLYGLAPIQLTSTGTADVKAATLPVRSSGCLIGVETTNARVTFDGTTPDSTHGVVLVAGAQPIFLSLANSSVIKVASTAAASSVVSLIPFR